MTALGPIRIGMSLDQLAAAGLVTQDQYPPPDDPDSKGCNQATLVSDDNVGLMFEAGILTRIEIDAGDIRSPSGIGIGSTEREAKHAYGKRLIVKPHFYTGEPAHYLKIFSRDGRYAMVFETDGTKIVNFRSGLKAPAQYVEGCS